MSKDTLYVMYPVQIGYEYFHIKEKKLKMYKTGIELNFGTN